MKVTGKKNSLIPEHDRREATDVIVSELPLIPLYSEYEGFVNVILQRIGSNKYVAMIVKG